MPLSSMGTSIHKHIETHATPFCLSLSDSVFLSVSLSHTYTQAHKF